MTESGALIRSSAFTLRVISTGRELKDITSDSKKDKKYWKY